MAELDRFPRGWLTGFSNKTEAIPLSKWLTIITIDRLHLNGPRRRQLSLLTPLNKHKKRQHTQPNRRKGLNPPYWAKPFKKGSLIIPKIIGHLRHPRKPNMWWPSDPIDLLLQRKPNDSAWEVTLVGVSTLSSEELIPSFGCRKRSGNDEEPKMYAWDRHPQLTNRGTQWAHYPADRLALQQKDADNRSP